jgi:ubiquinone/menaquinone biosynthesis C-methylase UbiE
MCRRPSHPILAATLDLAMRGLKPARERAVPRCEGDVLEVGVGTGLNFAHYDRTRVTRLCGIEPDHHMLRRAAVRADKLGVDIELSDAGAEELPYADASFDVVLCTFVLCTIPDVTRALDEMRRVLRPGGQLVFAEHVRAPGRTAARVQDVLNPVWGVFAGGCHLNRDAGRLITEAGFGDVDVIPMGRQHFTIIPIQWGSARG